MLLAKCYNNDCNIISVIIIEEKFVTLKGTDPFLEGDFLFMD